MEWLELGLTLVGLLIAWLQLRQGSIRTKKKPTGDAGCIGAPSKKILSLAISGLAALQKKGLSLRIRSPYKKNPLLSNPLLGGRAYKKNGTNQVMLDSLYKKSARLPLTVASEKKKHPSSGIPLEQEKALDIRLAYCAVQKKAVELSMLNSHQKKAVFNSTASGALKKKLSLSTIVDSEEKKSVVIDFPIPEELADFLKKAPEIAICY